MGWLKDNSVAANDFMGAGGILSGRSSRVKAEGYDLWVVAVVLVLLAMGSLMVYSASISLADSPKYNTTYGHFVARHIASIVVAVCLSCVIYQIPMRVWRRISPVVMGVALVLLVAVLIPHVGKTVNGASRWISVGGINFQVSELGKFAAVLGAAWFAVTFQQYMHSFGKGFLPMAFVLACASGLVGAQPDLGATLVIICITMGILFLGGLNIKIFIFVLGVVIAAAVMAIVVTPWRVERVMAYLNPWDPVNAADKAYQLSHSLIAFGRGEWFGVGIGASVEKLQYLPEAHTDFILAVLGEELGFAGVAFVLVLFYLLIRRAFAIGRQAVKLDRVYAGLVAEGVGIWISVQVVINAGVATGVFPTKGLTLPFMSYGGSSLAVTIAAVALLLRVDRENRILMRGGRV